MTDAEQTVGDAASLPWFVIGKLTASPTELPISQ